MFFSITDKFQIKSLKSCYVTADDQLILVKESCLTLMSLHVLSKFIDASQYLVLRVVCLLLHLYNYMSSILIRQMIGVC